MRDIVLPAPRPSASSGKVVISVVSATKDLVASIALLCARFALKSAALFRIEQCDFSLVALAITVSPATAPLARFGSCLCFATDNLSRVLLRG